MRAAESTTPSRLARLTRRERECLELVAQHWRTKDIARQLGLSPATVDEYVRSAVRKLETPDRAAAARVWLGLEPGPAQAPLDRPPDDPRWSLPGLFGGGIALAAKWSLLIGGAAGGVVVLLSAIAQAGQAFPDFIVLNQMLGAAFWALIPLGCVAALAFGGLAERLAAAVASTAFALTLALNQTRGPDLGVTLTDVAMTLALGAIAFGYRRPLLHVVAAMCFLAVLTHLGFYVFADRRLSLMAYATVLNLWAYLGVAALVWSALTPDRHDLPVPTRTGARLRA